MYADNTMSGSANGTLPPGHKKQHTPGPWSVHLGFSTPMGEEPMMIFTDDGHGNGLPIARKEDAEFECDREEALANKRLIESAPALLAALKALKSSLMHQRRFGTDTLAAWRNKCAYVEGEIEDAISKATA